MIREIGRISTPGRRIYTGVRDMPSVYGGLGITIMSTPKGVMTDDEARGRQCRRRRSALPDLLNAVAGEERETMSRIGKNAIAVPEGSRRHRRRVHDRGLRSEGIAHAILPSRGVGCPGGERPGGDAEFGHRARRRPCGGTTRSNIQSMVTGVTSGFRRTLELQGVGYRAQMQGAMLRLQVGYSHDIEIPVPDGLAIECPKPAGDRHQRHRQAARRPARLRNQGV